MLVHFDKRFRDKYSFAGIGIWTHNLLSPLRREHKQLVSNTVRMGKAAVKRTLIGRRDVPNKYQEALRWAI